MFRNKSAWFSSSVPQACNNFWRNSVIAIEAAGYVSACQETTTTTTTTTTTHDRSSEGGTVAGWRTADYLFSEDATCEDTLRIFESKDYLWNKVAVFHSLFLSACEKRQSVKSVCIGHYVLPPASVQDEVRHVVGRLIWECEDEQSVAQGFHKSFSCQSEDENSDISKSDSEPSDTDSSESKATLRAHYPVSNMLTGYVSMDNLQKYSGEVCDFHAECFRCSVCKAHCCLT